MKTVSTKLNPKSHEYLVDLANKNGTTVSEVLREIVDQLIQGEDVHEKVYVDKDRRRDIHDLELEVDRLCRLHEQDIPEYKKTEYQHKISDLEDRLSYLYGEEVDKLESSLLDILNHKYWFYCGDKFVEYVRTHDTPLLEALDEAMECFPERWEKPIGLSKPQS